MRIEPELVRTMDDTFRAFVDFMASIPVPTDEESGQFFHTVSVLADAAKINYSRLRTAFDVNDQVSLAWSCRNLLELSIFTTFVLGSKASATEFAQDRLLDGREIATCLKRLDLLLNPGLTASDIHDSFDEQIVAEGITRTRYRGSRELAIDQGLQKEFEAINKVCSKFVHPTAWSLFTAEEGPARFPEARNVLYGFGANYFAAVFAAMAPHIRKWGLRHKPEPPETTVRSSTLE